MNEIEFNTLEDLYKRLKPALYSKVNELKRKGKEFVKEEDVWNYLVEYVWKEKNNLSLADMTSDILNLDDTDIISYVMNLLKSTKRQINTEEEDLL